MSDATLRRTHSPRRLIYVNGDLDETMASARRELVRLFADEPEKPILLVITSSGGAVAGMFALMDTIAHLCASGATIDGMVEGYAMSCAALLLQACSRRYAGPNATVMVHGFSYTRGGDLANHAAFRHWVETGTERTVELLGARTRRDSAYWRELMQRSEPRYFTAREALEIGLIDEIVGETR